MATGMFSDVIAVMAKALVDQPELVEVGEFDVGDGSMVVELRVAPDDVGKVIGKSGRTAESMRVVLSAAAVRANKRVHLDILD
jgi:predicted RNA-binding protein YlqC (UPF0109 family)